MTFIQSVILGVIQGATEFIPISSSGHLVIAPLIFNWDIHPQEAYIFDVLAQVATLIAVLIYFWSDLTNILRHFLKSLVAGKPFQDTESKLGWFLIVSTIPAGASALLFKESLEKMFSNPKGAALFLLLTSLFLLAAELLHRSNRSLENINITDAIWIGIFQVFALLPGVSRSGSTISGGMIRGLSRESSARYSFLMAVPVMLAAGFLAVLDLLNIPDLLNQIPVYLAGFASAAIVGYLSIRWLLRYLSRSSLYLFSAYCALLGIAILVIYF
jgi:undecaprenyl-diphosphatase